MSSDEFEDNVFDSVPVKMKKLGSDRLPVIPIFKTTKKSGEEKKKSCDKKNSVPSFSAAMSDAFMPVKTVKLVPDITIQEQTPEPSQAESSPTVEVILISLV